ncbi:MAG: RNA-binding protein [Candidatus Omnitrophica bacterium]|nr:RNA-binding protein [Candidatus Omnitrophota bacterium]
MSEENKIYVGNLEYSVDDAALKSFIESKGLQTKDVKVISDKYTGRSKGFGFVAFETDQELQKAIEALDGQDLNGRDLKVNKARPPKKDFDSERQPRF